MLPHLFVDLELSYSPLNTNNHINLVSEPTFTIETCKSINSSSIEFQLGLSLDQAKLVSLEREQGKIKGQWAQVVQTLQQLVITQNQNQTQPQARVCEARRREVVESKTEPSS